MNDITMTVVGNVVRDVELRFTTGGDPVASFRVASSTRRFDRANERWVDSDTHYFTVTCWRSMAHNVVQSLEKGMPVVVTGRLRSREVERPCGEQSHTVRFHDIEAIAVGPDLARGIASFTRVKREAAVESEARAVADALAVRAELGLGDADGEAGLDGSGMGESSVGASSVGAAAAAEGMVEEVDLATGEITVRQPSGRSSRKSAA
ncbi:MAG: single-stranded DNA-binding protein [Actinomycetales bacterium]|nr:single-stranded DNA-binding protein [Actinomycetales bacterium]